MERRLVVRDEAAPKGHRERLEFFEAAEEVSRSAGNACVTPAVFDSWNRWTERYLHVTDPVGKLLRAIASGAMPEIEDADFTE